MCALPRFGPNALANNIIAKRRVPRLLLPHAAGGEAVDVVQSRNPLRQPEGRLTASRFAPCRRRDKQAARSRPIVQIPLRIPHL